MSSRHPFHPCLLPPQVAILTVTEQAVPPTLPTPEDPAPLWGFPAAQGSPGDRGLQGEWIRWESLPCGNQGSKNLPFCHELPATSKACLPISPVNLRGRSPGLLGHGVLGGQSAPADPSRVELQEVTLDDSSSRDIDPFLPPLPRATRSQRDSEGPTAPSRW